MATLIELFKEPGFTGVLGGVLATLIAITGNYFLQRRKAKDDHSYLKSNLFHENMIASLRRISFFSHKIKQVYEDSNMGIQDLIDIVRNDHFSELYSDRLFVSDDIDSKIDEIVKIYYTALYTSPNDSDAEQLCRDAYNIAMDIHHLSKQEVEDQYSLAGKKTKSLATKIRKQ